MFWGLSLDPAKRYAKVVDNAFHISAAVLDTSSVTDDEIIRVFVEVEGYETLICNLSKKLGLFQFPLDLQFMEGSRIAFYTQGGKGIVHLSGYVVPDVDADDLDEEDLDLEEEEEEEDEEAPELVPINKKRKKEDLALEKAKKAKLVLGSDEHIDGEEDDSDDDDDDDDDDDEDESGEEEEDSDDGEEEEDDLGEEEEEDDDDDDDDEDEEHEEEMLKTMQAALLGKKDKKKQEKKVNGKSPQAGKGEKPGKKEVTMNGTSKGENQKKAQNTPAKLDTPKGNAQAKSPKVAAEVKVGGGVKVQDVTVGQGKKAKQGNNVFVYYTGKLMNGKVFDKCVGGKGFRFRLGTGEVIKGWDKGVDGMQVGGKRKITCPPKFAYGSSGAPPDIPPNSTLVFDVELRDIK